MLIKKVFLLVVILVAVDARKEHRFKWIFRNQKMNNSLWAEILHDTLHSHSPTAKCINRNYSSVFSNETKMNSVSNEHRADSDINQRYLDGLRKLEMLRKRVNPLRVGQGERRKFLERLQFGERNITTPPKSTPERNSGVQSKFISLMKAYFLSTTINESLVSVNNKTMHPEARRFGKYIRSNEKGGKISLYNIPGERIRRAVSSRKDSGAYQLINGSKYRSSNIESQKYPVTWYDSSQSRKTYPQINRRNKMTYKFSPSMSQNNRPDASEAKIKTYFSYDDSNVPETLVTQNIMDKLFNFFKDENIRSNFTDKYREKSEKDSHFGFAPTENAVETSEEKKLEHENTPFNSSNSLSEEDHVSLHKGMESTNVSHVMDSYGLDEGMNNYSHDPLADVNSNGAFGENFILVEENLSRSANHEIGESNRNEEIARNSALSMNNRSTGLTDSPVHVHDMDYGSGMSELGYDFEFDSSGFLNESEISESISDQFLKAEINSTDTEFRSLVFNPVARPTDRFQKCNTPVGEPGSCRYVHHCLLPQIIGSLSRFLDSVCIIRQRFIGVCCPDLPVHIVKVSWPKTDADSLQGNTSDVPLQPKDGCGISSKTRIVGGDKADLKEWPWMAALLSSSEGQFFCGGSLLNSLYVLTAAHCTFGVPRNRIIVRLGEYDFTHEDESPGEDYEVAEIRRHAQFNRRTLRNDIALLKLSKPARFGQFIGTLCLPEVGDGERGQIATLTGWGHITGGGPPSDVLLEASFPVWSNTECSSVHRINIPDHFLCAGARTKDRGACNGDSGGPLMFLDENSEVWKGIGIVSWGRRRCSQRFPSVFTRVTHYLDWINAHST